MSAISLYGFIRSSWGCTSIEIERAVKISLWEVCFEGHIMVASADDRSVEITRILRDLRDRPEALREQLFPLLYDEMKRIARRQMQRESAARTLQPTALVHEAYMRLAHASPIWVNRAHFLGCASNAMRQILVEYARKRVSLKRGHGYESVPVDEFVSDRPVSLEDILGVDLALNKLKLLDPVKAELLELKFFGGLTTQEAAKVLGLGLTITKEHLRLAKAWLVREFSRKGDA